jgi:hypothetical protein
MKSTRSIGAWRLALALTAGAFAALGPLHLAGCTTGEKEKPRAVRPVLPPRDVPSALRGVIASQASIRGLEPTRISGLGFVVGLNGSGGGVLNDQVAFHMEREMGLMGVGQGAFDGTPFEGMSPRRLLQSKDTAVVLVTASIPPGAPEGYQFDVFVRALNATSLEGGRLYTTDLRLGPAVTFGGPQATKVGEAKGNIFINPFAEPGQEDTVMKTVGRILNGGVMTESQRLRVVLDNPSHGRARQVVSAINSRFPERPGDDGPIARGRDEATIEVNVPRAYLDKSEEFARILAHIQVDQSMPHVYARRYVDALRNEPYLAEQLSWALHALGDPALPFLRELYDQGETIPRLAALRTGARLGDPRVAQPLLALARTGPESTRTDAIGLLGRVDGGPTVDEALKQMLAESSLPVRVAAYEALAERAERSRFKSLVEFERFRDAPVGMRRSAEQLRSAAEASLPGGTIYAVSRVPMYNKFKLDRVPVGEPLIYVTQQGTPRIVLFGQDLEVRTPSFVSAWSDRLMMVAETPDATPRLYYEAVPGRGIRMDAGRYAPAYQTELDRSVPELVDFFAREWTPDQQLVGLGMTYSEVVGALHEFYKAGALNAAFATERDRLLADLLAAAAGQEVEVRPETPADRTELVVFDQPELEPVKPRPLPGDKPSLLEPIAPRDAESKKR